MELNPLRSSQNRLMREIFNEIFESNIAGGVIGVYNESGYPIFSVNHGLLNLLGYSSEDEFISVTSGLYGSVIHPEDYDSVSKRVTDSLGSKGYYNIYYRIKKKDCSYIWIDEYGKLAVDDDGREVIICVVFDSTTRREYEENSKKRLSNAEENENELQSIIDKTPGAIMTYELINGTLTPRFVNRNFCTMIGYSSEEYRAMTEADIFSFIFEEDVPIIKKSIQKLIDGADFDDYECRHKNRGGYLWVHVFAEVAERKNGSIVYFIALQDVTSRKLAEEELNKQDYFRKIIDSSLAAGTVISSHDTKLPIAYISESMLNLIRRTRAEFDSFRQNDYRGLIHSADLDRVLALYKGLKNQPRNYFEVDFRIMLEDKSSIILLEKATLIGIKDGCPEYLSIYIDVTRERREENARRALSKEYNDMLNDMPGGFVKMRIHSDGVLTPVFINNGFCRISRMTHDEVMLLYENSAYSGVHPDDIEGVQKILDEAIARRETVSIRMRLMRKDKSYVPVNAFYRYVEGEDRTSYLYGYYTDISPQVEAEKRRRELLDNLPCGATLYRINGDKISADYINERYCELLGRSKEALFTESVEKAIYPADLAGYLSELKNALRTRSDISTNIRILSGNGSYKPFHINGRVVRLADDTKLVYATYMPISEKERSLIELMPIMLSVMMRSSTDFAFVKDTNHRYICSTRAFANLVGFKDESDIVGKSDFDLFDKALAEEYLKDDNILSESGEAIIDKIEPIPSSDGTPHYTCTSKYPLTDGNGIHLGLYGISHEIIGTNDGEFFRRSDRMANDLLEQVPCGIGIFKIESKEKKLSLVYLNEGFFKMMNGTREDYSDIYGDKIMAVYHKDDVPLVNNTVRELINGIDSCELTVRIRKTPEGHKWLRASIRVMNRAKDCFSVYVCYTDMDAQVALQNELRRRNNIMQIVINQSGKRVYRYDIKTKTGYHDLDDSAPPHFSKVVPDLVNTFISNKHVAPESIDAYTYFFSKIESGVSPVSGEFLLSSDNSTYRWYRQDSKTIMGADGKPDYAVISYSDCTELHEEKERYQKSISYRKLSGRNIISSCYVNFTRDYIEDGISSDASLLHYNSDNVYSGFVSAVSKVIPGKQFREGYREKFSAASLIKSFADGNTQVSFEHLFPLKDNDFYWIRTYVEMAKNPDSGDIEGFIYSIDIDNEQRTKAVLNKIVEIDYDYIVLIDRKKETYHTFVNNNAATPFKSNGSYNADLLQGLAGILHSEDRERVLEQVSLAEIARKLKLHNELEIVYHVFDGGEERSKKLTCLYLDSSKRRLLFLRSDITDLIEREERQRDRLTTALDIAQNANTAKSDFLSRMSHDIRTPMNAIVGMTDIAINEIDNREQVAESLRVIKDSSAHLLTLINDILDMSRIESGKMVMSSEAFSISKEYRAAVDVFRSMAENKRIEFRSDFSVSHDGCTGDPRHLNRIIFNLLGNALKFTDEGGTVEFYVSERPYEKSGVGLYELVISDTGIGMNAETRKHIFDSFYRADTDLTGKTEGTGLGLSIVKSIIDFCGGTIDVTSELGKGSCFTVRMPFPLSDTVFGPLETEKKETSFANKNLYGIKVLLAEDNEINQVVASHILKKMNASVVIAKDGAECLEHYLEATSGSFSAILMDLRMPKMNGYEATAKIRSSGREDSATIPIIAMTADAFAEDIHKSHEAGMNAHLTKPIEVQKLYEALKKYIKK